MRQLEQLQSFRAARLDRPKPERSATVFLEEPTPERLDLVVPGSPWGVLEDLYERGARGGTFSDIEDLERIRIRRDALANGYRMTDEAVELALRKTRLQDKGVEKLQSEEERQAVRDALAAAREGYKSRVRAAFFELLPAEDVASREFEQQLMDTMRDAPRAQQLRALVLLTVLAHMYANTSVYSDTSDEKEAPPSILMRLWKAVARWTKSAAPHQPVGSIYEIAQLNIRRTDPVEGESWEDFVDRVSSTLRESVKQRSLMQEAVEQVDLLFPFIQKQDETGRWVSDRLERTTWNLIFLMSMVGDHAIRPILDWLVDHTASLSAWWQRQTRETSPDLPLFAEGVREQLNTALEGCATWTRVMGALFSLLNSNNAHTTAYWFRFVRHWPDWNIETEEQGELVAGFNGGQLQALHALDDLFLRQRGSQIAVEMAFQEKYLADEDHRQLKSIQELMSVLRSPWRTFVELDPETTGRWNAVVWEILSFRVSHTSRAWKVLQEGENPSTGGMFEDEEHKEDRAVGERKETLGPDSPQHIHFLNAMVPRLLETSAGLIREDSTDVRYWHWSIGLQSNGESASDPHRRVRPFAQAVWKQRLAVEEQRSSFQFERAGKTHQAAMSQEMGAEEWSSHLRAYDPRWVGLGRKGETIAPSQILERALLLRRVEIFAMLDEVLLAEIAPFMKEIKLDEGEALFAEGDEGDKMYIVMEGALQIVKDDKPLIERGAMEIVGELAVLDVAPRSAGAVALEETHLLELQAEYLYELMDTYPEISRGILRVLCRRLRGN